MRRDKGQGTRDKTKSAGAAGVCAVAACLAGVLFISGAAWGQTTQPAAVMAPAKPGEVGQIDFESTPLVNVFDSIRDRTGVNLVVNWNALATLGVDQTTPITLKVHGVSTRTALQLICDTAAPNQQMGFYIRDGIINVTTQAEADNVMVSRVYPIGDLLIGRQQFQNVPFVNVSQQQAATSGGGNVQSAIQSTGQPNPQDVQQQRDKRVQAIIHAITSTIRPKIWKQNGGKATIIFFNNSLIITAPLSVQGQLGG